MVLKTGINKKESDNSGASGLSKFRISDKKSAREKESCDVAEKVTLMPDRARPEMPLSQSQQNKLHLSPEGQDSSLTWQPNEQESDEGLQLMPDIQPDVMAGNPEDNEEDSTLATNPGEGPIQLKQIDRKANGSSGFASKDIEGSLNRTKGQGNSLPDHTQSDLGPKMGADFNQVRIHTDSTANDMNKELGAKAFTHGNDIYFKSGKYNPGSSQGKRLIAHELTHTVQQGAVSKIQPKEANTDNASPGQDNVDVTTDNNVAQEQDFSVNQQEQAAQDPSQNKENKTPPETSVENRETQASYLAGTEKNEQQNDVTVSEEVAKTREEGPEAKKNVDENPEDINPEDEGKKEEQTKEEEGKESERLTDMVAPEMDGGAERLTKENEGNKGAISQDLTKKSAKKAQAGMKEIGGLAANEQKKEDIGTKMQQVDEAVEEKPEDKKAEVQSGQVSQVDALTPPETKTDLPKHELKEEMEDALPETIEDVDEFKNRGKGVYIGNQVSKIVKGETSKVESTYKQIEETKEPEEPKEFTPVGDIESPVETGSLNVGKGLVPEVEEEVTDLSEYSNESDKLLEREGIPEENLEMVDSGDLAEAKEERKSIKEKSENSPKEVKEFEKKEIKGVEKDLQKQESVNKKNMRSQREKGLQGVRDDQKKTKSKIEKEREKVTRKINGIYEKANKDVKQKLADLETKSLAEFDKVQGKASKTFENNVNSRIEKFKKKRYSGTWGWAKKGKDWLMGIDDFPEVKEIFESEKKTFIATLDKAITTIIDNSQKVIKECKDIIAKARKDIDEYVKGLKPALQKTGEQAQKDIKDKLDKLDKEVDKAAAKLKEKLQEKREAAIKEIEKKIEKMKEEMSGALSKLGKLLLDAALKFFKWALEKAGYSTKQIMGIINKGKAVITKIVTDPKGFFKNLGKGIGQGFKNFVKNIKKHLIKGLIDWLTGSLGDTGLVLPKTWNLKGIFSLFLQIMGLSYSFLRSRLVKYVGEPVVAAAEGAFEMIKNIRKEGPIALWKWIKEKAAEIKTTIFEGIRNWVIAQVVKKAIIKLVSMLNPAGAIVQAILTIYDVVMFFIDNWDRIVETVKTIFSTISDIAFGRVGIVAKKVEQIMAMTIPMIISFLARFLGLSGLAKVIQKLIKKVRQPVVKIVDKAAKWIAKKIKKIAGKIKKFGKKVKKKIKGGITKLFNWWKVKKSFSAKDGSKHKLYFKGKGEKAKLMLASFKPKTVKNKIKEKKREFKDLKGDPKKDFDAAIIKVNKRLPQIDDRQAALRKNSGIFKRSKKDPTKKKYLKLIKKDSAILKNLINLLTNPLYTIMTGAEAKPYPKVKYPYFSNKGIAPTRSRVKFLSQKKKQSGTKSTAHTGNLHGWNVITDNKLQLGQGGTYVKMHVVSEQLGGLAVNTNLTPAPQWVNSKFYQKVEKPAITSINHGDLIWYSVDMTYGSKIQNKKFINSISASYGIYEYDGKGGKWKENPAKKATFNTSVPKPVIAKVIVNINTENNRNRVHQSLKISKALAGRIIDYRTNEKKANPAFKFKSLNLISIIKKEFSPRQTLIDNIKEAIKDGRVLF